MSLNYFLAKQYKLVDTNEITEELHENVPEMNLVDFCYAFGIRDGKLFARGSLRRGFTLHFYPRPSQSKSQHKKQHFWNYCRYQFL